MRIFVVGATGYVGGHLIRVLQSEGHQIFGYARNQVGVESLSAHKVVPRLGSLADGLWLGREIGEAEATIFVAQFDSVDLETAAIRSALAALEGSGKRFIMTSGTGVLGEGPGGVWTGESYSEFDSFIPYGPLAARVALENEVRSAVTREVHAMVIRPPQVYGYNGSVSIPMLMAMSKGCGFVPYIGKGLNIWGNVHVDDLAQVYSLALGKGAPGALYHAIGGEHDARHLAEQVGRLLGLPARSLSIAEGERLFGPAFELSGCSSRPRALRTQLELGWAPMGPDMDYELEHGSYAHAIAAIA